MLNTTSAFIRFHGELEDKIKEFYENLSLIEKYSDGKEIFLILSKENKKHKDMILRTYQEVITDALEAAFPLTNLDESNYKINIEVTENLKFQDLVKKAIDIEEMSYKFCEDIGNSTSGLMADIPQSFIWVAKRKIQRKKKLEFLLITT